MRENDTTTTNHAFLSKNNNSIKTKKRKTTLENANISSNAAAETAITTTSYANNKCLDRFDKVLNAFYYKYQLGIFAYDLPCQHYHTKKIELQCRSADELATTKFFCLDCETFVE